VRKRLRLLFTWMWMGSADSESVALPSCPVISIAHSPKRSRFLSVFRIFCIFFLICCIFCLADIVAAAAA